MNFIAILKTLLPSAVAILNKQVPLWVALILAVSLAYYVTRPEPIGDTVIEYRDYWRPPVVKRPLPPSKLIQYQPIPKGELRVDTIRVPIRLTDYQLWSPSTVTRTRNSIVVRSFDVGDLMYKDYEYRLPQAKFDAGITLGAYTFVHGWEPSVELEAWARYKRVYGVARFGATPENPYVTVGVKYAIF